MDFSWYHIKTRWAVSSCRADCFLIDSFWPRLPYLLKTTSLFTLTTHKNISTLQGLRMDGAPLWVTKEMYFYAKTIPNAGCLLHSPSLFSGILHEGLVRHLWLCPVLTVTKILIQPWQTLPVVLPASLTPQCPVMMTVLPFALWAFVTVCSLWWIGTWWNGRIGSKYLLVVQSVLTTVHDCKVLGRGQLRLSLDFLVAVSKVYKTQHCESSSRGREKNWHSRVLQYFAWQYYINTRTPRTVILLYELLILQKWFNFLVEKKNLLLFNLTWWCYVFFQSQ